MIGRFLGSALMRRVSPHTLMCLFAVIAIALLVTTMSTTGALAMWSVVAIGLFNSVINLALLLGVNFVAKRITGNGLWS